MQIYKLSRKFPNIPPTFFTHVHAESGGGGGFRRFLTILLRFAIRAGFSHADSADFGGGGWFLDDFERFFYDGHPAMERLPSGWDFLTQI